MRGTTRIVEVGGFGQVWYDTNAIANIFGFKDTTKRYRITMDTDIENALNVHISKDKVIKFKAKPE